MKRLCLRAPELVLAPTPTSISPLLLPVASHLANLVPPTNPGGRQLVWWLWCPDRFPVGETPVRLVCDVSTCAAILGSWLPWQCGRDSIGLRGEAEAAHCRCLVGEKPYFAYDRTRPLCLVSRRPQALLLCCPRGWCPLEEHRGLLACCTYWEGGLAHECGWGYRKVFRVARIYCEGRSEPRTVGS